MREPLRSIGASLERTLAAALAFGVEEARSSCSAQRRRSKRSCQTLFPSMPQHAGDHDLMHRIDHGRRGDARPSP